DRRTAGGGVARSERLGMSFELTPRERRWFDAVLVLAAVALAFVVLGFVGVVFSLFADLIFIFFLAWLLAFILSPLVTRLRTAVPVLSRAGAVVVVYVVLFGLIVVLSVLVASALVTSISQLVASLPSLRDNLPSILGPWQGRIDAIGLVQIDLVAQADAFLDNLNGYAAQLLGPLQQIAVASLGALGNLLLVIILSLYMVADRDRLLAFLFRLVPRGHQAEARIIEEAVARSFGGFLRGQAITGLVYAIVALVANLIFGLDYAAATTAAAGGFMAIPFFGPFAAWIPPVLVAFLFKPDAVLGTFIVMGVGWVVLLNVLQPRIMGDALRIHPIVVLASVFIGLKLAGIGGAIFGIPIAAVLSAVFLYLLGRPGEDGRVAARAARRLGQRQGRWVKAPREPDPRVDRDVEVEPDPTTT
ncbi:MAG TPA: AI-2E family transporter, partial [Candidatus Limnocylindrales bacterium]|nr:AI-2E family transporter [Candidatus Limnocylindrales bacterium]